jgi:hypothetical protein
VTASGFNESFEEPRRMGIGQAFGVPLNPDPEGASRVLDGLDDPVRCPSDHPHSATGLGDALMVRAVHANRGLTEDLGELRTGRDRNGMNGSLPHIAPLVVEGIRPERSKVLHERAASSHRHELRPVADSQDGHLQALRSLEQGTFELTTTFPGWVDATLRALPVPVRWNVKSPPADQECGSRTVPSCVDRRNDLGLCTGAHKQVEIGRFDDRTAFGLRVPGYNDARSHGA